MKNLPLIIISVAGLVGLFIIFSSGGGDLSVPSRENVEIRDGVQYITVDARGGYYPNKTIAKAGIPTKLVMRTTNSFDCSSFLVIRSLNYQNILPQSGETEIDLGVPVAGEPLSGLCSMGMYGFSIDFE